MPRKNVRPFAGRPIISYAVETARGSGLFDAIIVSTDDDEIAEIAKGFGAAAPFRRPAKLADDFTGTIDVIAHATRWAFGEGLVPDVVCCIYPTTPFLAVDDLRRGYEALRGGAWDYSLAVTDYASPIFRSFRKTEEGGLEMFFPEVFEKRSQDLPTALHDAGQFYFGRPEAWLAQRRLFGPRSVPVELPRWRVHDIDTEDDWRRAELVWIALQASRADR